MGIKELKGIEKEKNKVREDSLIKKLIEVKDIISEKYSLKNIGVTGMIIVDHKKVIEELENNLLKNIKVNAEDITDFVMATSNCQGEQESKLNLGAFTGLLLGLYSKRKKENNERSVFHINGYGQRFNYLFAGLNSIDELVIENFKGDNIGLHMAGNTGKIDTLILKNIKGDGTAIYLASNGHINKLFASELEGKFTLSGLGANSSIDVAIFTNNKSYSLFQFTRDVSIKIGVVYLNNNDSNRLCTFYPKENILIDTIIAKENKSTVIGYLEMGPLTIRQIGNLFYQDNTGQNFEELKQKDCLGEVIVDLRNPSIKGEQQIQDRKVKEIMQSFESTDCSDNKSIVKMLDDIYTIQKPLKKFWEEK